MNIHTGHAVCAKTNLFTLTHTQTFTRYSCIMYTAIYFGSSLPHTITLTHQLFSQINHSCMNGYIPKKILIFNAHGQFATLLPMIAPYQYTICLSLNKHIHKHMHTHMQMHTETCLVEIISAAVYAHTSCHITTNIPPFATCFSPCS